MEKYIVFNYQGEPEKTQFEYNIGEVITVNSVDTMKCMEKKIIDGKLIQYFKKGIITFDY